jgi:type II secretory pathway pseudopilin PulG
MKAVRRPIFFNRSSDAGLTLVEVVAAVIVVVTVALAGAGLSINGIQSAAAQEREQVAVTIANGLLENVSGWNQTVGTTGVSDLYTGRYKATVATAFSNASSYPGVAQTYPSYDPTATSASVAAIPISNTNDRENGTTYTTTTLIGDCYELLTGGTCSKITGQSTEPSTTPTGYTQVIRVIVIVSWTAGSSCTANACYYEATTMADSHADLQWKTS